MPPPIWKSICSRRRASSTTPFRKGVTIAVMAPLNMRDDCTSNSFAVESQVFHSRAFIDDVAQKLAQHGSLTRPHRHLVDAFAGDPAEIGVLVVQPNRLIVRHKCA